MKLKKSKPAVYTRPEKVFYEGGISPKLRSATVKGAFLEAFFDPRIGGTEGLICWVLRSSWNRKSFYNWISRLLPRPVEFEEGSMDGLESVLNKYKDLSAQDLREKSSVLAKEVLRLSGNKSDIGKA